MNRTVRGLDQIDRTQVALVGGKAANLGELRRLAGVRVPPGFVVTTEAYGRLVAADPAVTDLVARLAPLAPDDREAIAEHSRLVRSAIEAIRMPAALVDEIAGALATLGDRVPCAVRSSATAEDQPAASFAGQQDTYLNVIGSEAVVDAVRRCWASLFSERAVTYRVRNGLDHGSVAMAVVVQELLDPDASGVAFTADPVNGDRRTTTVEAVLGLGEALVTGLVEPDADRVRAGRIVERTIGAKAAAFRAAPGGGTEEHPTAPDARSSSVLTEAEVLDLVALARRVEAHFGAPQDIEWCRVGGAFHLVQSRPITTLYPIPANAADGATHVYVSVGHQQMMTDPFRPFGLSMHQRIAGPPMHEAGGRLFVDVAMGLASPATRAGILDALGTSDPLIGSALQTLVDREGFLPDPPADVPMGAPVVRDVPLLPADPEIVTRLIERTTASVAELTRTMDGLTGPALFDAIEADIAELAAILRDPDSRQVVVAGIGAALWLDDHLSDRLGERNIVDLISRSAPGNVTAEMGLALLDVADVVRPHPEAVAVLRRADGDGFLDELLEVPGGRATRAAIDGFLVRYGMRAVGEIDITRPRWFEQPSALVPAIVADIDGFEPGEARRRYRRGQIEAEAKAAEVIDRLRALPGGEGEAEEAEAMIARVRTFAGFREFPKYGYICRFGVYKRALVVEADRLVAAGVLRERDDAWFLRFDELRQVATAGTVDQSLVDERRAAYEASRSLTPPRVMTSDGEVVTGTYGPGREVPAGALVGLGVSAGTVEGRARVVLDLGDAVIEPGDILVTVGTDPSWTPLFVSVAALVTEVGGLMTHGAVVAREYGLPAVVGVEGATWRIRDGDRIRVDGSGGYVELLDGR